MEYKIRKNCFHSLTDAFDAHETKLPFPKMLHILCQGIKDLDGLQTQGIFRISASKTDVDELKEYFFKTRNFCFFFLGYYSLIGFCLRIEILHVFEKNIFFFENIQYFKA